MNKKCFLKKHIAAMTIILVLLSVSMISSVYAVGYKQQPQKHVLVINSYHQGLTWSKDVADGILDTLKNSGENLSVAIEYMDWKNFPNDKNLKYLYDYYKYKYQGKSIDVIITSDDAALQFALKYRGELFSNASVVFCGVNQEGVKQITQGYRNITGVLEEIDPTETIKMALAINPSLKNVYILYDNSESGLSAGGLAVNKIKSMNKNLNTICLNNLTYDELLRAVKGYDKNSIILFTTYYSDVNGKIVEYESAARDVSNNSSVPVYFLYDMGLNNGAFGGAMTGGTIHGESASNLATRILNGENPDNIPVLVPKKVRKVFDYKELQRFNIPLSKVPKGCEVINKPFSFFQTYKVLVFSVIAAFTVLLTFVCILLFYIMKIRKMKRSLSESHEELTQTYEELTASQEDLQQQYQEVLSVNEKIRISEEKLAYLAYHDALTGLPNKLSLFEEAARNIISANSRTALLFLDIDNFKYINDSMGHAFGDQLIVKASERLTSLLKDNCSIYRLSGDEFIILMQNIKGKEEVEAFCSCILNEFKGEFNVLNSVLLVGLSIGIVMYPEHGNTVEELIRYADIAMYKAKEMGRKNYVVYDRVMNEAFTEKVNIEKHLHGALEKNEFEIYYQPQLELKTNKVAGLEALLRWKSPQLGSVSPLKFIKAAEDSHLIIQLGEWVLKNACAFLKNLHGMGYNNLSMAVNISMLQLLQSDFNDMVLETLEFFELDPHYLELEITESILMESYESIVEKLEKLSRKGVKIALDDFGMGYSSLSYLKQLPISTLKIDKSFIDNISDTANKATLTGHIVTIGKSMGMCVIAEGVERQEQLDYLTKHHCDKIQGYLYSRPVPESELLKLMENK